MPKPFSTRYLQFPIALHIQYLTPIRTNTSYPTQPLSYTYRTQTLFYPLAYSFLLLLHIEYLTLTRTKTYITPILQYIISHLSLSYQNPSLPPVNDSDTSYRFSCRFKLESRIGNRQLNEPSASDLADVADSKKKKKKKKNGYYCLALFATVTDSHCSCRFNCRFKNTSSNRQPAHSLPVAASKKKLLLLSSFVSRMLAAIFWPQLPIQIVVTDSVADSKIQVRIGNRQLCFKNAGSHTLATVADSDCSCRFSCRF